ncbi:hypothetical protein BKA24_001744 [Microbacterium marinum]|uniref:Uncharacterized protein n=1 Tax=Microbacterium marinum TaxID=421115 RepID=A0A7W7BQQ2_9MICO|nr:hypothetical protein [Microbacterium marinum]MBB4667035.1 hypothetical protein [Microbacterium marinum]
MSSQYEQNVVIPRELEATRPAILAAITAGIVELGDRIVADGRRAIWDKVAIVTDEEEIAEGGYGEIHQVVFQRSFRISVQTVSPDEVAE